MPLAPIDPTEEELGRVLLEEAAKIHISTYARAQHEIGVLCARTRRLLEGQKAINPLPVIQRSARAAIGQWLNEVISPLEYHPYATLMQKQGYTPLPREGFNKKAKALGGRLPAGSGFAGETTPLERWLTLRDKKIKVGDTVTGGYLRGEKVVLRITPEVILILGTSPDDPHKVQTHHFNLLEKVEHPKTDTFPSEE